MDLDLGKAEKRLRQQKSERLKKEKNDRERKDKLAAAAVEQHTTAAAV